jgi:hypothetical protein
MTRTAVSTPSRSSALLAAPCNATTKEQELTLIRGRLRECAYRPSALRTSWTSCASLAGAPTGYIPADTLPFRPELGHEAEAAVAQPALVE